MSGFDIAAAIIMILVIAVFTIGWPPRNGGGCDADGG